MPDKPSQRPPLDELDHLVMLQMRLEGETLHEIAQTFHTSRGNVAKILRAKGIDPTASQRKGGEQTWDGAVTPEAKTETASAKAASLKAAAEAGPTTAAAATADATDAATTARQSASTTGQTSGAKPSTAKAESSKAATESP